MPQLTDVQRAERVNGLGGTDMAALAGVSRWAKPIDVFFDKRPDLAPERPERETKPMQAMGHLLEPVIASLFSEATGVRLRSRAATIHCRDHPWEIGHLDRRVHGDPSVIFEAKWAMSKDGWAPTGTIVTANTMGPLIPPGYGVQVQWYLHVTGARYAWLAALLGWADFRYYRVERDPGLIDTLVELGDVFWHQHVVPGVPPEPDGSEQYDKMLRRLYPRSSERTMVASPHLATALHNLRRLRDKITQDETDAAAIEQQVMDAMRDAAVMDFPGGKVTWRQNKPSHPIDWPAVARALARELERQYHKVDEPADDLVQATVDSYAAQYTSEKEGKRPLVVKFSEESSDADY